MNIRLLAERMSRGVVLRRRLPPEFGGGRLYVSPENGGMRWWKRDVSGIDPTLLRMAREHVKEGMTVWDVGANLGLFTFAASHRAGPKGFVLAVEPDVDNVTLLLRSNRARDPRTTAPVEVLPVALSGEGAKVAKFQIAMRSRTANALAGSGSVVAGGWRETRAVPLMTLDELLGSFPAPQVIKIDVEGAEVMVLSGGKQVLGTVRPIILCEVSPDDPARAERVGAVFREHGYRMYDYDAPAEQRTPLEKPAWSTLAVPA